eukprot:scaffold169470_cov40-Cyclotella_meneghiniana.AAC.1
MWVDDSNESIRPLLADDRQMPSDGGSAAMSSGPRDGFELTMGAKLVNSLSNMSGTQDFAP